MQLRERIFLSFVSPKERNKEKETTKTNHKPSFYPQMPYATSPRNLRFALFVDISRTVNNFILCKNKFMEMRVRTEQTRCCVACGEESFVLESHTHAGSNVYYTFALFLFFQEKRKTHSFCEFINRTQVIIVL